MYPAGLARPVIAPVDDGPRGDTPHPGPRGDTPHPGPVVDALWETVLDADQAEGERVVAAWKLAGARDLEGVARRLAVLLREPTLWLGCELVEVLATIAPDLAFGVDVHGLVAVSPTPLSELVSAAGACPSVGVVVGAGELASLAPRLADALPWLVEPRGERVVAWCAYRTAMGSTVRPALPRSAVPEDARQAMNDFPWSGDPMRVGDVVEIENVRVQHKVARAICFDEHRCGVLSYFEPAACVLDGRRPYAENQRFFRYFYTHVNAGAFRFRVAVPSDGGG